MVDLHGNLKQSFGVMQSIYHSVQQIAPASSAPDTARDEARAAASGERAAERVRPRAVKVGSRVPFGALSRPFRSAWPGR